MKREYIKPAVEVVDMETMATCVVASWHVDGPGRPSTDQGYIIEDPGKDHYTGNEKDDPWNSDNW